MARTSQRLSRPRLDSVTIRGFKTIRELKEFRPGPLSVLIGPNGAGKSNFLSFFRMLSWALAPPGGLQEFVGKTGGASAILHDGSERTSHIEGQLRLITEKGSNDYAFRLAFASADTLIFTEEKYRFSSSQFSREAKWTELGAGHRESNLLTKAEKGEPTAKVISALLRKVISHQFHNTSDNARIRQKWDIEEGRWLKEDAGNLAPFLYRLSRDEPGYYKRIVDTIRLILPFFADFQFEAEYGRLLLKWRERESDRVFNSGQAADGMLRIFALVALLEQPESDLPDVLLLDEPELGLHPYAIEVISEVIRSASNHVQVILATQSVSLIDRFNPEDIVVVERRGRDSHFGRLSEGELTEWLEQYTLSELWEKNVIGGRP
ncbi:MAG: AAA family ATPase [Acidobacteriaceae bacterium]|nr:AAA family ATPase [Acidobacteriaceae bacterium]